MVREEDQGPERIESNQQLKRQNKIVEIVLNIYIRIQKALVESADEVLATHNVVAPVQQHRADKLLQRTEPTVHDIVEMFDLHQTPAGQGTLHSARLQLQN